jgi:hypothetical protein
VAREALLLVSLVAILGSGCRRETPIERGAREYREEQHGRMASAALETMRIRAMTDAQILHAYRHDGLSLGARPEKTQLHIGEPLKLHLAYENIAAGTPISATTCQGFLLTQEDETTGQSTTTPLTFTCPQNDPLRDNNLELRQGELKTAEITTAGTSLHFDHPGRYRIVAEWQSFRPSNDLFLSQSGYPRLESNPLLITVR